MQGTIAQVVALVIHGNTYLSLPDTGAAFPESESTLTFCEFVRFVDLKGSMSGQSEMLLAPDPASWLRLQRSLGVYSLRMTYIPSDPPQNGIANFKFSGFVGGGGRWLVETIAPTGSDYWEARWQVGNQKRSDRKIWRVTYGRIARDQPTSAQEEIGLGALKQQLTDTLIEISAFARRHNLDYFAQAFESGLSRLQQQIPGEGLYHKDLIVMSQLPLPAAQLLGAAQSAWVFGGMGSWNDLGFDRDDQWIYEELSGRLYELINASIVASANSSSWPIRENRAHRVKRPWWRF